MRLSSVRASTLRRLPRRPWQVEMDALCDEIESITAPDAPPTDGAVVVAAAAAALRRAADAMRERAEAAEAAQAREREARKAADARQAAARRLPWSEAEHDLLAKAL